ncbi:hypothetical protein [Caballeronia pedi]|nr:hypothetical protein [Caballeronia pedi]
MNSADQASVLAAMPATEYAGVVAEEQFDSYGDLLPRVVSTNAHKAGR